jgi:proline iminopeptidase
VPEIDDLASVCRVVAYDQRGRGRSRGPRAEDVTMASEIDDLDAVRRAVTDGQTALLGHSWGGVLAMAYAAEFPERVSKLVLLGTGPATHHDWVSLRDDMARHRRPRTETRSHASTTRRPTSMVNPTPTWPTTGSTSASL